MWYRIFSTLTREFFRFNLYLIFLTIRSFLLRCSTEPMLIVTNCNFPMTRSVILLVGLLVSHNFLKGREAALQCFNRITCLLQNVFFLNSLQVGKLHQVVETGFPEFTTFSVGEGVDRRTVVCFQQHLLDFTLSQTQVSNSTVILLF